MLINSQHLEHYQITHSLMEETSTHLWGFGAPWTHWSDSPGLQRRSSTAASWCSSCSLSPSSSPPAGYMCGSTSSDPAGSTTAPAAGLGECPTEWWRSRQLRGLLASLTTLKLVLLLMIMISTTQKFGRWCGTKNSKESRIPKHKNIKTLWCIKHPVNNFPYSLRYEPKTKWKNYAS